MTQWATFEEWGEGIGTACTVIRANAMRSGLSAPVPTCPGWDVRELVTHQGVVHRWATARITQGRTPEDFEDAVRAEIQSDTDLLDWFDDGMVGVLNALAQAPPDLDVPFFLRNAPTPLLGWARRQCHETTIHAVDAMAAALGREPVPAELWIKRGIALDGIDELLTGFVPRSYSRLRAPRPAQVVVLTDDASWTIGLSPDSPPTVTTGGGPEADLVLSGDPVELYLGLWNRGEVPLATGDLSLLDAWRSDMQVRWS